MRDALTALAYPWARFSNPIAAVHTVLKRLVQQREAHAGVDEHGDRRDGVRQTRSIAIDRDALKDDDFLQTLLAADSPERVVKLVESRRARARA